MSDTPSKSDGSRPEASKMMDPRPSLTETVAAIGSLIASTKPEQLQNETPCDEFSVAELQDHLVFVLQRMAALGNGQPFSSVEQQAVESGWSELWAEAAAAVTNAWQDSEKLSQKYDVPWGTFAGAPVLYSYTGELAAHGWDLAQATGRTLAVDDVDLTGALMAVKMIPAEGREVPEMPFDMPVEVGPDATTLERIAAWQGRKVS